jgi:uncharacterized protein YjbI with pentapeptide repeats
MPKPTRTRGPLTSTSRIRVRPPRENVVADDSQPASAPRRDWPAWAGVGTALLAAIGALFAVAVSWSDANEQAELTRQGQFTDRYSRAVEQLGTVGVSNVTVRLGGIYALQRLAHDSEEDRGTIVEVLAAFVRDPAGRPNGTPPPNAVPPRPPTDVAAALKVLESLGGLRGVDLHGADLAGADLAGADLYRANLRDADLTGAELTGANLFRANLRDADLIHADLIRATLFRANLRDADLTRADLIRANLSRTNLRDADLTGAELQYADLIRANLFRATLRGADLIFADLADAALGGADLRGADLFSATLRGANLAGADLRDADLQDADLRDAVLAGAAMRGADLQNADLRGALLRGAMLRVGFRFDPYLGRWTADRTRGTLRRGGKITIAELSDADFGGADLRDAKGLPSPAPTGGRPS